MPTSSRSSRRRLRARHTSRCARRTSADCSSTPSRRAVAPAATPSPTIRSALSAPTSSPRCPSHALARSVTARRSPGSSSRSWCGRSCTGASTAATVARSGPSLHSRRGAWGDPAAAALRTVARRTRATRSVTATSPPRRSPGPPPPDAIVAVPLGPRRRRQRGYNQSDIVARVLADRQQAPMLDGLRRIRETTPQSARDEQGRRRNVAGAFAWKGISARRRPPLARRRRAHDRFHGRGGGGGFECRGSVPRRRRDRGRGAVTGIPCQNEEAHVHVPKAAQQGPRGPGAA